MRALKPRMPAAWLAVTAMMALLGLTSGARAEEGVVPPGSDVGAWSDRWTGDPRFHFNRVDGALVGGRLGYQREGAFETAASAELSYATARRKGVYRLEVRQSLGATNRLHVDAEFHRLTLPFEYDGSIVGNMENTLAALLFRNDYRDWYEGQGARLALRWRARPGLSLALSALREEQCALLRATDWGVFHAHEFRDNPAASTGTLNTLRLDMGHDSRSGEETEALPFLDAPRGGGGHAIGLSGEIGGGDFSYALFRGEARGWWRVTHGQILSGRLMAAQVSHHDRPADLPAQKQLYVGGISTLRGHSLKAFTGDRLLLANVEYAVTLFRNLALFAGTDVGRAWERARVSAPRFACDAAAGLMTRDGRLRLQWARDARDADAPVIFSVRTRAAF